MSSSLMYEVGDRVSAPGFFEKGVIAGSVTLDGDDEPVAVVRLSPKDRMWAMPETMIRNLSEPKLHHGAKFTAYLTTVVISYSNLDPIKP